MFILRCCVCVSQVEEEKKQEKGEDVVELRSWSQQKEHFEDDTQVNTHISM